MTVGENIRLLRKEKNLTQQALADQTGIPVRTIINYENSSREPNAKNMAVLERFFNVSGEFLRGESEIRNQEHSLSSPDTVELLRADLPSKLKKLSELLENASDTEAEVTFHIVHELSHILTMQDSSQRSAAMSIFQDIAVTGVFFLDICETTSRDTDATDRIEYAKRVARDRFEQALEKSHFFLPD